MAVMFSQSDAAFALGQPTLDVRHDPSSVIRQLIEQQLQAIRKDDAELAFSYTSPVIRQTFRDAASFMALLAKEYEPLKKWQAVTFLEMRTYDDHYLQRIKVTDKNGNVSIANYAVIKNETGEWFVGGMAMVDEDTKAKAD
jgi:hypothetical protein